MYIRLSTSEGVRADPEKEGLQGRETRAAGTLLGRRTPVDGRAASVESANQPRDSRFGLLASPNDTRQAATDQFAGIWLSQAVL